jgi:hypothetical protein
MIVGLVTLVIFIPAAVGAYTQNEAYVLVVVGADVAFYFWYYRKQFLARVKNFKFYENHPEISGWKFRKQYSYQDLSWLSLTKKEPSHLVNRLYGTHFELQTVAFAIKDEPMLFQFENPRNKSLETDLYSWLARKVSPDALRKPASSQLYEKS